MYILLVYFQFECWYINIISLESIPVCFHVHYFLFIRLCSFYCQEIGFRIIHLLFIYHYFPNCFLLNSAEIRSIHSTLCIINLPVNFDRIRKRQMSHMTAYHCWKFTYVVFFLLMIKYEVMKWNQSFYNWVHLLQFMLFQL